MKNKPFGLTLYAENDDQINAGTWTCIHVATDLFVERVGDTWEFNLDGEHLTEEQMKNKLWLHFKSIAITQYLKD